MNDFPENNGIPDKEVASSAPGGDGVVGAAAAAQVKNRRAAWIAAAVAVVGSVAVAGGVFAYPAIFGGKEPASQAGVSQSAPVTPVASAGASSSAAASASATAEPSVSPTPTPTPTRSPNELVADGYREVLKNFRELGPKVDGAVEAEQYTLMDLSGDGVPELVMMAVNAEGEMDGQTNTVVYTSDASGHAKRVRGSTAQGVESEGWLVTTNSKVNALYSQGQDDAQRLTVQGARYVSEAVGEPENEVLAMANITDLDLLDYYERGWGYVGRPSPSLPNTIEGKIAKARLQNKFVFIGKVEERKATDYLDEEYITSEMYGGSNVFQVVQLSEPTKIYQENGMPYWGKVEQIQLLGKLQLPKKYVGKTVAFVSDPLSQLGIPYPIQAPHPDEFTEALGAF
ncbi:hypothetical protein J2S49_001186 [Arcanobacterium wilhelmae]|uniref:Uncharacterized protein n=1 Tax=Arcanobacterium wilhelmae TaxID=1803177 RepID=A0ABT9NBM7_9ACTO|nr:hypothetical protein [Arcanobacterium wilhelmae]MDP9801110.1 hypothetical protein [Arcanobacterium wilhelmae]WFN90464.1 hypothetical protein P8A24_00965 [Arcanobacterium wilhelmae]